MFFSLLPLLPLLPLLASASPFPRSSTLLNSSYVDPIFQQSRPNIESDALASIRELLGRSDFPSGWVGQNAWTVIAQWDHQHQTRTFYDRFVANESNYAVHPGGCFQYWHSPLVDCFNDDAGWAALASLEGYAAYGDQVFLQRAESVHEFVSNHGFINQTVIAEGYLKGTHYSNNTLQPTCDGHSLYGGVYWQNGIPTEEENTAAADPSIDSGSTAVYALLSAKLCAITSNKWYCDRSYDALQFMDRFMIDPTSKFVTGPVNGTSCGRPLPNIISTTSTGNYFAAYAILSNLTSNTTALTLARQTTISSLTSGVWNSAEGVLSNVANVAGLKSVLIRNLHLVHPYMDLEVQNAITQYVNIQYWSLVNFDSNSATKPLLYGTNWNGPKYSTASGRSQLESIDVLNALALNPNSAFPNVNSTDMPVISR